MVGTTGGEHMKRLPADNQGIVWFTIIYPPIDINDPTSKRYLDIALHIDEINHSYLNVREMIAVHERRHGADNLEGGKLFVRDNHERLVPYEEFE
jgi:hypothetical protein